MTVEGLDREQCGVKAKLSLKGSCALCPHRGAKLCFSSCQATESRERLSSCGATGRMDQPPPASKARAFCLNSTWGKASQEQHSPGFIEAFRDEGAAHPACEDCFLSSRWKQPQCWSVVTSSLILQHTHNPSLSTTSPQSRNLSRFSV